MSAKTVDKKSGMEAWLLSLFGKDKALAESLISSLKDGSDGAHDLAHIGRVWVNAMRIASSEGGNISILAASVLMHDCVSVEKNSEIRSLASKLSADRAVEILKEMGWRDADCEAVYHAIEAHSFSANVEPRSLEVRILQDADRLDAIGFIGIARCFYTAGRMGSKIYDPTDVTAESRDLFDKRYALDHFSAKLFHLANSFRTKKGRELARRRHEAMRSFYDGIVNELSM